MSQILALLFLLKKLMLKELSSFSSVRFNNFLFCILFIMVAGLTSRAPEAAFWSTLLFQIVLLAPLLVTFSVDTQHRLPPERVATWPLTRRQRLLLSSVSFALNPLFIVLFLGYLFWMGLATGLFFLLLALIVHGAVYAVCRLPFKIRTPAGLSISRTPLDVSGIAQETWRELLGTLEAYAREQGFTKLFLYTTFVLPGAKRLYEKNGFYVLRETLPEEWFDMGGFEMEKRLDIDE